MTRSAAIALSAAALLALAACADRGPVTATSGKCEAGPVTRKLAGADWRIYSCEDGKTLVAHPAGGGASRAILTRDTADFYSVKAKGRPAEGAAAALHQLSYDQFNALIAETRAVAR